MTVAEEQDGPPPIPLENQAEIAGNQGLHSTVTTTQGESGNTIRPIDPNTPLVMEETLDPVDVIMHDEPKESDMDLLSRIHGLYRLLDLISEQGSGGTGMMIALSIAQGYSLYFLPEVDKIVISQESVAKLVNDICPGAYTSMTRVRAPMVRTIRINFNMPYFID